MATGIKLANPKLKVIAIGGDGDGFAIGMGHFPHAIRRNVNMLYTVLDNSVYGLTKGQSSPTTHKSHPTKTNPYDMDGDPFDPVSIALAAGATFVARIFSGKMQEMLKFFPKRFNTKDLLLSMRSVRAARFMIRLDCIKKKPNCFPKIMNQIIV